MGRKIQEDLIIPEEISRCDICQADNGIFLKITPYGEVTRISLLCSHADKSKLDKKLTRLEAARFLKTERDEAEKNLRSNGQISDEKKDNIMCFISKANAALIRLGIGLH